jgi:hypothetical protein
VELDRFAHEEHAETLAGLTEGYPDFLRVESCGRSVEGQPLLLATVSAGWLPKQIGARVVGEKAGTSADG